MERNPKFDPKPNEPTTVKLVKNFKNGVNDNGPYYGWEIESEGQRYTWFLNEPSDQQEVKALFDTGQQANVTLRLKRGEKPRYEIKSAFFDSRGNIAERQETLNTPEGLEAYRKKIKNALVMAYEDVDSVKMHFAEKWQDKAEAERVFTPDVCQKLATSVLIDYLKKS